jgi:phenylacetate-CoA ligase
VDILAPVVRHVIAPLWALWEHSPYLRIQRSLLRTQYDPPDVIQERQWRQISSLVQHAYETTSFWRDRLDGEMLSPRQVRSYADFRKIPILTKNDICTNSRTMQSSAFYRKNLVRKTTSGSTGVAVEVLVDDAAHQFKRACTLRSDEWSGWRLGERIAAVWGNPAYLKHGWRGRLRNALLERSTYLDTLKMGEAEMTRFAETLHRYPPALLFGHAHSLYLFAQFLRGRCKPGFRPKGIISTAMVLHDRERRTIEGVFQCPVTNRYGCEEVSLIACECDRHEGLHVNADGIYLEILRSDGTPCDSHEPGMAVVTDLINRAMPIIRYQVGDTTLWTDRTCSCGRGFPLIERIEGRVADYVITPKGELISGISLTENFAIMVPGLAQLQIIQEAVDRFLFRIVRSPDFGSESLRAVGALVAERFGPDVRYQCEYVDHIPQEPSGKYRFCISKVPNPYTACRSPIEESSAIHKR